MSDMRPMRSDAAPNAHRLRHLTLESLHVAARAARRLYFVQLFLYFILGIQFYGPEPVGYWSCYESKYKRGTVHNSSIGDGRLRRGNGKVHSKEEIQKGTFVEGEVGYDTKMVQHDAAD